MPSPRVLGALAVIAAILAVHIWFYFFLCDDAYIMFRYARNLTRGRGLVFNVGERVEGYTSLLWVLQLAGGYLLGVSGELFPHVLSLGYTAGALLVWWAFIMRQANPGPRWAVALVVLLALSLNRSWAVWATSGMETRAFTFFVLLAMYMLTRAEQARPSRRTHALAGLSVVLALATFTRPDAQLLFPLIVAYWLITRRRSLRDLIALILPFVALVGAHYLWRFEYYGVWLPNTYYAKVTEPWPEMGRRYLSAFVLEYGYYLIIPFIAATWHRAAPLSRRIGWLCVAWMTLHAAYYCYRVGGDHFEFRIFDFYAPLILWMAAEGLVALYLRRPLTAVGLGAVMLVYSLVIPMSAAINTRFVQPADVMTEVYAPWGQFKVTLDNTPIARWLPGMSTIIEFTRRYMIRTNEHFIGNRQEMHRMVWRFFKSNIELAAGVAERQLLPPMVVASANVGILGYYVDVPVLDMRGLTDAYVAHAVLPPSTWRFMAHERWAPTEYLDQRHAYVWIRSATRAPLPQDVVVPGIGPADRVSRAFSIRLGGGVWLNIASWNSDWVHANFQRTATDLLPNPGG